MYSLYSQCEVHTEISIIVLHKPFVCVFFKQKSSDFLLRNNSTGYPKNCLILLYSILGVVVKTDKEQRNICVNMLMTKASAFKLCDIDYIRSWSHIREMLMLMNLNIGGI